MFVWSGRMGRVVRLPIWFGQICRVGSGTRGWRLYWFGVVRGRLVLGTLCRIWLVARI